MKSILMTLSLLLLIFSCKDDGIKSSQKIVVELNKEFVFGANDIAYVETDYTSFFFELTSIIEDSRCPTNARCIWQGRFIAEFNCNKCSNTSFQLGDDVMENPNFTIQNGYRIELLEINPYPTLSNPIGLNDYNLLLVVSLE